MPKIVNDWEEYEKVRGKLIRKTYSAVTKILGEYKRCSKRKNHPLLKDYIATIEESLQDFQKEGFDMYLNINSKM